MVTQSALALLAAAIGLLVVTNLIQLWMIWAAALLLGLIMSVDRPALLGFVKDLVGEADLPNAVALNTAVISSGRMIGPVIGGPGPEFFHQYHQFRTCRARSGET